MDPGDGLSTSHYGVLPAAYQVGTEHFDLVCVCVDLCLDLSMCMCVSFPTPTVPLVGLNQ